jgi:hypothetical protein
MKLVNFLFKSTLVAGIVLAIRHFFFKRPMSLPELQKNIDIHLLAAVKSSEEVMEKSSSSSMRELAKTFNKKLLAENENLKGYQDVENANYSKDLLIQAEALVFNYDYNEELPFDLAYASHQLNEASQLEDLLNGAIALTTDAQQDKFINYLAIVSAYKADLDSFIENFLTVNEYRIRDVAHQIWEAEGRPEGQAVRHWTMAVEILKKISTADLQLALEQKRSLFDAFSTAPEVSSAIMNKNIH